MSKDPLVNRDFFGLPDLTIGLRTRRTDSYGQNESSVGMVGETSTGVRETDGRSPSTEGPRPTNVNHVPRESPPQKSPRPVRYLMGDTERGKGAQ